jgi:hypothetical protein
VTRAISDLLSACRYHDVIGECALLRLTSRMARRTMTRNIVEVPVAPG